MDNDLAFCVAGVMESTVLNIFKRKEHDSKINDLNPINQNWNVANCKNVFSFSPYDTKPIVDFHLLLSCQPYGSKAHISDILSPRRRGSLYLNYDRRILIVKRKNFILYEYLWVNRSIVVQGLLGPTILI